VPFNPFVVRGDERSRTWTSGLFSMLFDRVLTAPCEARKGARGKDRTEEKVNVEEDGRAILIAMSKAAGGQDPGFLKEMPAKPEADFPVKDITKVKARLPRPIMYQHPADPRGCFAPILDLFRENVVENGAQHLEESNIRQLFWHIKSV